MPKVNFYALQQDSDGARLTFACRLAQKAFSLGHKIHIQTASPQQSMQLDDLLWTASPASFLPHSLLDASNLTDANSSPTQAHEAITIGIQAPTQERQDVLINLSEKIDDCHANYAVINEIVLADPGSLKLGREHYRFYQSQQYSLQSHKI